MKQTNFYLVTIIDDFFYAFIISLVTFGNLFFFEFFDQNIILAFLPTVFLHLLYAIIVPECARFIGRIGTQKAFMIAILLLGLSAIPIYFFETLSNPLFIIFWILLYAFAKPFIHIPILFLLGKFTDHNNRSKRLAISRISIITISVLTPIAGGFIAEQFDFIGLVLFAVGMASLAIIPAMMLKNYKFDMDLNLKKMLKTKKIKQLNRLLFFRIPSIVGNYIWIIFLFLFFSSEFNELGILIAVTSLISAVLVFFLGRFMTDHDRLKSVKAMFALDSLAWFTKSFTRLDIPVVFNDTFGKVSSQLQQQSSIVLTFDYMNDSSDEGSKDEIIVEREIIINLFIAFYYLFFVTIVHFFGFESAFFIIGLLSLFYSAIKR